MAVIIPRLRPEHRLWRSGLRRVVGVDEVGVAPTCGPVVAAAVIMPPNGHRIRGVRDSKTLSTQQRERLDPLIRAKAVAWGVGAASVAEIDRLNIYHATHLAMRRAIARLGGHDHVLVDGNRIVGFEAQVGPYTSIVDGDATCYSIACASMFIATARSASPSRFAPDHRFNAPDSATFSADDPAMPAPTGDSDLVTIDTSSTWKNRAMRATSRKPPSVPSSADFSTSAAVPVSSDRMATPGRPSRVTSQWARMVMAALIVCAPG